MLSAQQASARKHECTLAVQMQPEPRSTGLFMFADPIDRRAVVGGLVVGAHHTSLSLSLPVGDPIWQDSPNDQVMQ